MSPELPEKAVDTLVPPIKEALGEASLAQSAPQNASSVAGIMEGGTGKPDVAAAIEQHRASGPAFADMRKEYAGAVTAARDIVEAPTTAGAGSNTEGSGTAPAGPTISAVWSPAAGNAFVMPNGPTGAEGAGPQAPMAPPHA